MFSSAEVSADGFWFEELLGLQTLNLDTTVSAGVRDGVDVVYEFGPSLEVGLGAQIQFGSQVLYQSSFGLDNVFLFLRLPFRVAFLAFYPVGRVGYGFFFGNADYSGAGTLPQGPYYAIGGGCRSPDFDYTFLSKKFLLHAFVEGTCESGNGFSPALLEEKVYSAWSVGLGLGLQVMP